MEGGEVVLVGYLKLQQKTSGKVLTKEVCFGLQFWEFHSPRPGRLCWFIHLMRSKDDNDIVHVQGG